MNLRDMDLLKYQWLILHCGQLEALLGRGKYSGAKKAR